MSVGLDERELRRRLVTLQNVAPDERPAPGEKNRKLAGSVRTAAHLREAVDALVSACVVEEFENPETVDLMMRASRLAKYEYGIPDAHKALGFQALTRGDSSAAMEQFETAVMEGNRIGSRPDARSRACFAYWHDRDIDGAYDRIGRDVQGPTAVRHESQRRKVALVTSSLIIDASTTSVSDKIARLFRERAFEVVVISTEFVRSGDRAAIERIEGYGAEVFVPSDAPPMDRLQQIVAYLNLHPVDLAVWFTWPLDSVAKVASVVRLAPKQAFINHTCEQACGDFDLVLYCASPREVQTGTMRGERRYIGTSVAARAQVETAAAFSRGQFGVSDDAVILGTYGRISKCCDYDYVRSLSRILRGAPQARLIIAGYVDSQSDPLLRELFDCEGVSGQVIFPGNFPGAYYGIYKITDIYCDPFFWRGGQSVLEAMAAGVPVVALRSESDPVLDPTGTGCMSNSADLLGTEVPVAPAGDYDEYVRIALKYVHDPHARRADGEKLRVLSQKYTLDSAFDRLLAALADIGFSPAR